MPNADITGCERSKNKISLGAYTFNMIASEFFYGELKEDGTIGTAEPTIPLFDSIPNAWFRSDLANSLLARAIKIKIMKRPKTNKETLKIRLSTTRKDKTPYNIKSVDIPFYKNGEEGGMYVFQTTKKNLGKAVLFTKNKKNIGNFDEAAVLFINDKSDRFHYQIINQE